MYDWINQYALLVIDYECVLIVSEVVDWIDVH